MIHVSKNSNMFRVIFHSQLCQHSETFSLQYQSIGKKFLTDRNSQLFVENEFIIRVRLSNYLIWEILHQCEFSKEIFLQNFVLYWITVMIEWEIVEIKLTRQFTKISIICTSRWKFEMIIFRSWRHESNSRKLLEAFHEILLSRSFDGNFQNKFSRNCSKNRCRNRKNY